ncbi:sugar-binding domain-containing protein [Lederbergia panacisoli]|uniref:sugar-binding domain-containing protein n=1 Tax=Lederbergia panacisoli TaxID=1255251 RepID=UPI00214AC550|nr:sugar-binding domain-containing protein [Lederbergia panacisoli]MCR2823276.1 beta-glucuronidase [Lederbergia panacisoli]
MKHVMDLSGGWGFMLDNEKKGLQEHFENDNFTDSITLPNTTSYAKKGEPNPEVALGHLTDTYKTEGYAWFSKSLTIEPSDIGRTAILTLERTRISHVWIDDQYVGTENSLCTSHKYDVTKYISSAQHKLTIMTSNVDYPVGGGHMTSPDTQTNWNGILGEISLSFYDAFRITKLRVESKENVQALVNITVFSEMDCNTQLVLTAAPYPKNQTYPIPAPFSKAVQLNKGENHINLAYVFPDDAVLWDEYDPGVYQITATITDEQTNSDSETTFFGLKVFKAEGTHFSINGRKTFLRGKHEGMIFPLTGYAPMDVDGWYAHMKTSKEYGINHYRFHTCCPPKAAFIAADLLGIYMQPELPFWGTFTEEKDENHDASAQNYLIQEGFRMLDEFGNHPSFVMMSMGNELWGSPESINELVGRYKEYDNRHLYTQGSNNFQWVPNIQPNDDFFSGVRFTMDRQIRGSYAMCDAPLGHVQVNKPGTNRNYEEAIHPPYTEKATEVGEDGTIEIQYGTGVKRVKLTDLKEELVPKIPVVSHEIGQYQTYPNFAEIKKYTGPLKARNFEVFRERLEEKGLLSLSEGYFHSSGKLAAACYKDELETAIRTSNLAGYQILDLQDFSGQGTALVGMLDAFMDNKGIVTAEEWRMFCSDAVLQAEFADYILAGASKLKVNMTLSYYRKQSLVHPAIRYSLNGVSETLDVADITDTGVFHLGAIMIQVPSVSEPTKMELAISIDETDIKNTYDLWIYPECPDVTEISYVTSVDAAIEKAANGKNALLLLEPSQNPNSIQGTYSTDFWCYPMFRSISESMGKEIPIGTMGLLIKESHSALTFFPSESYSTPQWWDVVMNSSSTILDDTRIEPIVQTIDNFERNHRLGLIYEVTLENGGHILICSSPLHTLSSGGSKDAAWLLYSLSQYISSDALSPSYTMTSDELKSLFI